MLEYSSAAPTIIVNTFHLPDPPAYMRLTSNQKTLYYTAYLPLNERIQRWDLDTDTALPDFIVDGSLKFTDFALLPPYDGSGGLLAAASAGSVGSTYVHRYAGNGTTLATYMGRGTFAMSIVLDTAGVCLP